MTHAAVEVCVSCLGGGELGTDNGPVPCPDCFGEGRQLGSLERTEWRLRDIERARRCGQPDCAPDVSFMVQELRRCRDALIQILARCQDDSTSTSGLAADVQFIANHALGLYPVETAPARAEPIVPRKVSASDP